MENNIGKSQLLTISETSKLLKVHPNTLRNWDKQGVLKAIRIGGSNMRRYKLEDINKYLEDSK